MGSNLPTRPAPNNGGKTAAGAVTKPLSPDDVVLKEPPLPTDGQPEEFRLPPKRSFEQGERRVTATLGMYPRPVSPLPEPRILRIPYGIARRIAFVFDPGWRRFGRTCKGWARWGDVSFKAFRIAWGPV